MLWTQQPDPSVRLCRYAELGTWPHTCECENLRIPLDRIEPSSVNITNRIYCLLIQVVPFIRQAANLKAGELFLRNAVTKKPEGITENYQFCILGSDVSLRHD